MSEEPFFNRITRERPEALIRELHILHEEEIASLQKAHEAAIAERDAEIKRLRKVVDAALELEYVLRTPEGRADVDSFTAQPIRLALADMGIDLFEDEEDERE